MQNTSILTKIRDNKDRTRLPDKSVQTYIDVDEVRKLLKIEGGGASDSSNTIYIEGESSQIIWGSSTLGEAIYVSPKFYNSDGDEITPQQVVDLIETGAPLSVGGFPLFDILESESSTAVAFPTKKTLVREGMRRENDVSGGKQLIVAGGIIQGGSEPADWGLVFTITNDGQVSNWSAQCSIRKQP